jgi:hypothetical protein
VSSDSAGRPWDEGGLARKLAASLATVAAAAAVVALPTYGAFTDDRTHFTDSVLAPVDQGAGGVAG